MALHEEETPLIHDSGALVDALESFTALKQRVTTRSTVLSAPNSKNIYNPSSYFTKCCGKFTKPSLIRLGVAILLFVFISWLMAVGQVVMGHAHAYGTFLATTKDSKRRYTGQTEWTEMVHRESIKLDFGFTIQDRLRQKHFPNMPSHREFHELADLLTNSFVLSMVIFCLFMHDKGIDILRRFFFLQAIIYGFRGCTMYSTLLPPCEETCPHGSKVTPDPKWNENVWLEGLKVILKQRISCTDLMFSGHTSVVMMSFLTWHANWDTSVIMQWVNSPDERQSTDSPRNRPSILKAILRVLLNHVFKWCLALYTGFVIVCLIFSRTHYTVDCVVAILITSLVWMAYFGAARALIISEKRKKRFGEFISKMRIMSDVNEDVLKDNVTSENAGGAAAVGVENETGDYLTFGQSDSTGLVGSNEKNNKNPLPTFPKDGGILAEHVPTFCITSFLYRVTGWFEKYEIREQSTLSY